MTRLFPGISGIVVGAAVGVAVGAVVVVAGCSSGKTANSTGTGTSPAPSSSAAVPPEPKGTRVVVDGQDQHVSGTVTCDVRGGYLNIGMDRSTSDISANLKLADPPVVLTVSLGNIKNFQLAFDLDLPGTNATATKDGNTYTIKGNAIGVDRANPTAPITAPFEIEVTCP